MSNAAKVSIAVGALLVAGAIFYWQFGSTAADQTKLSKPELEVSAKLAQEAAERKVVKPGQPAPPPAFVPIVNETFNRR